MSMKKTLISLEAVVQLIAVVCTNPFNFHDEIYIRYLILVDKDSHAMWLDNPSPEDCQRMFEHCNDALAGIIQAPCNWCHSRGETKQ